MQEQQPQPDQAPYRPLISAQHREHKPDFLTLYNHYHLNDYALARASGVSIVVVHAMWARISINREAAAKVLEGINKLTGEHYTLDQVNFRVID